MANLQSNAIAAIFALALSATFIGMSILPAEVATVTFLAA
jgi:hypothetical protein